MKCSHWDKKVKSGVCMLLLIAMVCGSLTTACFFDMFESDDKEKENSSGDEDQNNDGDEWTPPTGTTQSKTIGISGGTIEVTNNNGDNVTLEVPEFSLILETEISVTVYDEPTSPHQLMDSVIFPGVYIEPSDIVLRDFTRLTVVLADSVNSGKENMLFKNPAEMSGEEPAYIVPVGVTERAKEDNLGDKVLEATLYEFGLFFGGTPTKAEYEEMEQKINTEFRSFSSSKAGDTYGWQTTMTASYGAVKIAEGALLQGYNDLAESAMEIASEIAEDAAQKMLEVEPPSACDEEYVVAMARHQDLLFALGNPSSTTFDQFYDAFSELMDECMNRCRLYFSYTGTTSYSEGSETISYEGPVVITSPYGGEDYGYPVSGEGELDLSGSGVFGDECTTSISGVMQVGVKGKIELMDNYQDLELIIDVTCNADATKLFECESGNFSSDLPLYQEFHFEIPFEDQYSASKDLSAPGYSGTITVILYIEKFSG